MSKIYRQTLIKNHLTIKNTSNSIKRVLKDNENSMVKSVMEDDDILLPKDTMMIEKYTFFINLSK